MKAPSVPDHTIPVLDTWSLGLKGWASIKSAAMSEDYTTVLGKCHISSTGETVAGKYFPVSDSGDRVKPWVWGTPVRSSYTRLNLSKRYNVFESSLSSFYLTRVQLKFKEKHGKAIWRNNWLTQTKIKFTFYHLIRFDESQSTKIQSDWSNSYYQTKHYIHFWLLHFLDHGLSRLIPGAGNW